MTAEACPRCGRPAPCGLRIRILIAGMIADEVWLDRTEDAAGAGNRHADMCADAEARGLPWLLEVYDPDLPEPAAYVRYGTDLGAILAANSDKFGVLILPLDAGRPGA